MKLKRLVATLMVLAMMLVCLPMQASAEMVASGSWSGGSPDWEMYSDGVLRIFGKYMQGSSNSDAFPWKAPDFPVVKRIELVGVSNVAAEAFSGMDTVESVSLDSTITTIGSGAFASCKSLKSITIPASVKTIEAGAFMDSGLQTVTFEENSQLTVLGGGAFRWTAIEQISLPEGITQIYMYTFDECVNLKSIVIPNTVERIESFAFRNCESLTHICFPEALTFIAKDAFQFCTAVTTIELYKPLHIREYFYNYKGITKVVVHGDATRLEGFDDLQGLTDIEFPETITVIGDSAFSWCKAITDFPWPKNLTTIESYAFNGAGMVSVVLPETVNEVGSCAFSRNPNLVSFVFSDLVSEVGSCTFEECSALTTVDLGNVTQIGFQAFYNCSSLKKVELPDTLKSMGYMAFYGCTSLEEITIPESVTQIDHSVFMNCSNLKEIRFEGHAPVIEPYCFSGVTATVYYPQNDATWTNKVMDDYGGDLTWVSYCRYHTFTTEELEADCLNPNRSVRTCTICGEVEIDLGEEPPKGHDYGLAENGKDPDFWDTTCDVCGAERKVDKHRPTHSMYRMYNPNSGEHFYTGSMEERKNLESFGWKYEGVGFTFPATTGKPVYRLYDKYNTAEHLYTMDEAEKEKLLAEGWVLEGVAFNSGREDEVAQYRLHNPNAGIGAYHFTASSEERDMLISLGWEYQGIGFYTCWQ